MTAWRMEPISAVCTPTQQRDPRENPACKFQYVDIGGIDRTHKRIAESRLFVGAEAPSRARKVIQKGDVLVSTVRPNLNAVAIVPEELDGEIASTGFCVLRANRALIEPRYLFYRAVSADFISLLSSKVRGASYPAVSDRDVKNIEIPVPSLSEQRRIVEVLDQADRLRRLRAEADTKSDRIFPALVIRTLGHPVTWGSDPRCMPLDDLVRLVSGATPSKQIGRFWSSEIPWVTPKDMKMDFLSDSQDHVSQAALDETDLRVVEQGSALIVVRGMILARDVPVASNLCPVTINQDMKALIPKTEEVTGTYVWAALLLAKESLRGLVGTAGHGTRKLHTRDLMQFSIPQPHCGNLKHVESAAAQHRLALEHRQESGRLLDRLFAVALGKAFDGSLTFDWREAHMKELLEEMATQASRDNHA